ncbi:FAD/NAD(P)-binding domain-containing protein [Daldinia bambusicola]|nr:FAD/NAD(P)-binding domain-containing protein [Daldinia bambusicola]
MSNRSIYCSNIRATCSKLASLFYPSSLSLSMLNIMGSLSEEHKIRIGQTEVNLPAATYPSFLQPRDDVDPQEVATNWITSFERFLQSQYVHPPRDIFFEESYWRDHLCFSWDFQTWHGPEAMNSFLGRLQPGCQFRRVSMDDSANPDKRPQLVSVDNDGKVRGVQLYMTIETDAGTGRGLVRLLQEAKSRIWKAFTVYTALSELRGHEENIGRRRRPGHLHNQLGSDHANGFENWQAMRDAQRNFEGDLQPTVLIIGAGQAGLSAAARLTELGMLCLVIDQHPKVGDCWRNRYLRLVLHDPVWYNHMPYLPFPVNWPVFAAKDKVAEFLESYAQLMDLNTWSSTVLRHARWDDRNKLWDVTVERRGSAEADGTAETRSLRPRHIIQATGVNGEPKIPNIEGMSAFHGRISHSSQFRGAQPAGGSNGGGKRAVVVVGSGVSGHDIAQDFFERGHRVTLVQRGATCIDRTAYIYGQGLYSEDGPATEDADFITHSVPLALLKRREIEKTDLHMLENKEYFEGLERAGFSVDRGPDGAGRKFKFLQYAGGSYIDVGASQLIIDGQISVERGAVARVTPRSLVLDSGAELPADEIVFATGYTSMLETTKKIMGAEFAARLGEVWGIDAAGELRSIWRRSGHPGYWFAGGNFALCRYYSKMLALQIKAIEEGIMDYKDL